MRPGVLPRDRKAPASPGRRSTQPAARSMQHPAYDEKLELLPSSNSGSGHGGAHQIWKDDLHARASVSPARAGFAPWRPRPTSPMVAELAARQHQQQNLTHWQSPAQKHPAHVSSHSSARASNSIRTLQLIAQAGKAQARCNSPSGGRPPVWAGTTRTGGGVRTSMDWDMMGGAALRGASQSPVMGLEGRSVQQSPTRMMPSRNSWHGMPFATARQAAAKTSSGGPNSNTSAGLWPRGASSPRSPMSLGSPGITRTGTPISRTSSRGSSAGEPAPGGLSPLVAARRRASGSMSARRGASEREKERERVRGANVEREIGRGGDIFSRLPDARCPKDHLHVRAPHGRQSGEKGGRDVLARRLLGAEGHDAQEEDSASGWEEDADDFEPDTPIGCPRA